MPDVAAPAYPWYGAVSRKELEQGDILLGRPRFVLPPEVLDAPAESKVVIETVNVVILTQSCDLAIRATGQCEVKDVMLCRFLFKEELAQHSTFKQEAEWENARKGRHAYFHVLNRCDLPDVSLDFMLVDFHEVYTLNIDLVRRFATSKERRPRLLPPYREHLAQAFARLFMRVGLPTDIPPFREEEIELVHWPSARLAPRGQDTVEADVYFSLGQRINLFQGIVGKLQPILSRLPKEFEAVALEKKENREAARQRLLAEVDKMACEANEVPFDIDEIAEEALEMPKLPEPSLTMTDLDKAFNRTEVRPPDMAWRSLDAGAYAVQLPGMAEEIRATTSGEGFDDHGESHVFLSPAGEMFDSIVEDMTRSSGDASALSGHVWLVTRQEGGQAGEVVVFTTEGPRVVKTLGELLESIQRLGEAGRPDTTTYPEAEAQRLA